jgi:NAD(P)-dependent dehydrogenase (short-subunit alcohol dehydrogenase family)
VTDALGANANLLALPLDVTDETQARAAATAAVAHFGQIDVLLNNAGFGLLGAVEEASANEVDRVYRTNVFGSSAYRCPPSPAQPRSWIRWRICW